MMVSGVMRWAGVGAAALFALSLCDAGRGEEVEIAVLEFARRAESGRGVLETLCRWGEDCADSFSSRGEEVTFFCLSPVVSPFGCRAGMDDEACLACVWASGWFMDAETTGCACSSARI